MEREREGARSGHCAQTRVATTRRHGRRRARIQRDLAKDAPLARARFQILQLDALENKLVAPPPDDLVDARGVPPFAALQVHRAPRPQRLAPVRDFRVRRPEPRDVVARNPLIEARFPSEEVHAQLFPAAALSREQNKTNKSTQCEETKQINKQQKLATNLLDDARFEPLRLVLLRAAVQRVASLAALQNVAPHRLQRVLSVDGKVAPRPERRERTLRAHDAALRRGRRRHARSHLGLEEERGKGGA